MSRIHDVWKAFARGAVRVLFDRAPVASGHGTPPHVVVLRWDAKLGDAIVSSPFYREIRGLAGVRVTVVTVAALAAMHERDFGADCVIVTGARPGLADLMRVCRQLRQAGPVDAVVHLVGRIPPREIVFIHCLQAARVYSLDASLRLVTHRSDETCRETDTGDSWARRFGDHYLDVLRSLGVPAPQAGYIVPMSASERAGAPTIDILFNPFGSRADKSLSAAKAAEVLRALADTYPHAKIGVLSSPATRAAASLLARQLGRGNAFALNLIDTPGQAAAAVNVARAVVSVDTAIVHMAVGLGRRLVAIYADPGAVPNPWLPPVACEHRIVLSRHDTAQYARTGIKDMNCFSAKEIVDAMRSLEEANAIVVKGRIGRGLGVANGTLARQLPMIESDFPDVSACFRGTLNVTLARPLWVTRPDHRTPPLAWTPSGRTREVFDLLRVELALIESGRRFVAWLYVAHGSPHRLTPDVHELIAPKIELNGETCCALTIRAGCVGFTAPTGSETAQAAH
ncbi:glycosyltransferase family 9 protein [Paraburkholderia caribensis]|uniref:glycosyltransferase family 9 protein n=1 Tax=Paraburkholderia caribensis TaxID=75105 RepID=UPI001CAE0E2C|nr:glycosyltransferase family 9 protein [Paraburkholderia caribensis]CAG9269772.1 ADP-heptose:LPS heptosyltransferase [Paraburkholderia caribensis]